MTDHHDANESADDWTKGMAAFVVVSCPRCRQRWYLPRSCCPACGYDKPQHRVAKPEGVVAAATVVHRAPAPIRRRALHDRAGRSRRRHPGDGPQRAGHPSRRTRRRELHRRPSAAYFQLIEAATADVNSRERSQTP